MVLDLFGNVLDIIVYWFFVARSQCPWRVGADIWIGWRKKISRSRSKTIPKWSEWAGMLGSSVEMFLTEIPYVSKKSISLFGVLVVEFGRLPNSWMNGLSIPLCNLNHSIEKGFTPFLLWHSAKVWLASIINTIACCSVCKSCMITFSHFIALALGQ